MASAGTIPPVAYGSEPDVDPTSERYQMDLALWHLRKNATTYSLYRDYYLGDHRLAFATDRYETAFGHLFAAFADNMCPAVVDAVGDRLVLEGFGLEGNIETALDGIWSRNRMDRRAGEVHQEALREGDGYVLVWPDEEGLATIYPQRADRIVYIYSEEKPGQVEWAAKGWRGSDARYYLTMYYEDRIEKYITKNTVTTIPQDAQTMLERQVEGEPWPLPNEYGRIPLFHFASNAPVGGYGKSELADVVPIQDALNKTVTDMLVAGEYVALPQRYATGLEVQIDPDTGKPVEPFRAGVERMWTSPATDTKFGEFPGADLSPFVKVSDSFRTEVARVSGTPFHYLMLTGGDWPSGEAMKTAEARFLSRVHDRMDTFGNAWEDAARFALAIEGTTVPDESPMEAAWADPAPKSEKEHAETVQVKVDIGLPKKQALLELGYTEDQVDEFMEEKEAEVQAAQASFLQSFDRGNGSAPEARVGSPGQQQEN